MVGQHIGKYRVTEQVGRGGMGTVYRGIDETLHREVAIKVLNAELSDPSVARRFRAEAVTVARLNHPGLATIYELVEHDGQWLMVMEFVKGETLEHLVSRKGPLPIDQATDIVMHALAALAHAHGLGVVHRDLKPANIMVTDGGGVKVMDFGIARVAGSEHLTSAGFMMGTPAYMAPEQVLGHEIDARTDLYAMGVVLYQLVSGKLPFNGGTPFAMAQSRVQDPPMPVNLARSGLPAWLGRVLDISLAREPGQRFQSALLFREALRRGLANLPIETPTTTEVPPELVTTAAPGSLPIGPSGAVPVPVAVEIPKSAPPSTTSIAEQPTIAGSLAVAPPESGAATATLPPSSMVAVPAPVVSDAAPGRGSRSPLLPIAAILALAVVGGGFWWMRQRGATPTPVTTESTPMETTASPSAATPAAAPSDPQVPAAPVDAAATTPVPPAKPAGDAAASSASSSAAGTTPVPAVADGRASGSSSSSSAVAPAARAAGASAAASTAASARGRGRQTSASVPVVDETPVTFSDLRAFVVTGKKAEEQPAVLKFGGGQISLVADKGDKVYVSMGYKNVTSAAFVRAKNPRWFPTLDGPPNDLDMPGGLFRSARGWLALQSRTAYLIVRLNDTDQRKVFDTVTERTGLKVEVLAAP